MFLFDAYDVFFLNLFFLYPCILYCRSLYPFDFVYVEVVVLTTRRYAKYARNFNK